MSVLKRLIFFLLLMVMGSSVINAQDSTTTVQWDTIMAEILIIESMTAPDSLKQADMVALFDIYDITLDDYRAYYDRVLAEPEKAQMDLFLRVSKILRATLRGQQSHRTKKFTREVLPDN